MRLVWLTFTSASRAAARADAVDARSWWKRARFGRRSTLRLCQESVERGYALACQAVVEDDVVIHVPVQEKIERQLASDRMVAEVSVPDDYDYPACQSVRRLHLTLTPPSMDDQTDDWARLQTALRVQYGIDHMAISLPLLARLGAALRMEDWRVTAIVDMRLGSPEQSPRLVDPYQAVVAGVSVDVLYRHLSLAHTAQAAERRWRAGFQLLPQLRKFPFTPGEVRIPVIRNPPDRRQGARKVWAGSNYFLVGTGEAGRLFRFRPLTLNLLKEPL